MSSGLEKRLIGRNTQQQHSCEIPNRINISRTRNESSSEQACPRMCVSLILCAPPRKFGFNTATVVSWNGDIRVMHDCWPSQVSHPAKPHHAVCPAITASSTVCGPATTYVENSCNQADTGVRKRLLRSLCAAKDLEVTLIALIRLPQLCYSEF